MRGALYLVLSLAAVPTLSQAATEGAPMTRLSYPETRRVDQVDEQFGIKVADPYRWLENDVRTDPAVAAWVAAENRATDAYLATLPARSVFADRLKALLNYERFGLPVKRAASISITAIRDCRIRRQSMCETP